MARKKLIRFAELKQMHNVWDMHIDTNQTKDEVLEFAKNSNVVLELGCGKAEYTTKLAQKYPDKKFIGIDIQGERIWYGAKFAIANNLQNVRFLRASINNLNEYFESESIDEIWITFPDPFVRDKDERRRLTSKRFLDIYKKILKPNGTVHLKTDSIDLYNFTLNTLKQEKARIIASIHDIAQEINIPDIDIETTFEKKAKSLAIPIKYINFGL